MEQKATLPVFNTPDFTPLWPEDKKPGVQDHTIGSFSLTSQEGKPITEKNVRGKIYVANFFFTTCGSICPRMMTNLKKLALAFQKDTNVLLLSHSVLPEVDSVSRLQAYARRMDISSGQWLLLTGDKEQIYTLARRAYFADEELGYNRDSNEFLHTENCLLIDRLGRIRGVYNATLELEIDKLIKHVRLLEEEY
jgi:protein SCO1/2